MTENDGSESEQSPSPGEITRRHLYELVWSGCRKNNVRLGPPEPRQQAQGTRQVEEDSRLSQGSTRQRSRFRECGLAIHLADKLIQGQPITFECWWRKNQISSGQPAPR